VKYILDTDILIYFLKGNVHVVNKMTRVDVNHLSTTIINHAELFFGAYNSAHKKQNLEKITAFLGNINILPFCIESSKIFAEKKANLKKESTIMADLDLMIASIAIKNKLTFVTNNTKHFARFDQLTLENWHHA
jgi:tRNA(fMet)-specific endonuclease VapC